MNLLLHFLEEIVATWIAAFLFLTGQVLITLATLGRHRMRWWELQDPNARWPATLLGLAFWLGLGFLLAQLF